MSNRPVKSDPHAPRGCTRRQFLHGAAAASAGVMALPPFVPIPRAERRAAAAPPAPSAPPWWLEKYGPASRVVDVRAPSVLIDRVVDTGTVNDMIQTGLRALTGLDSIQDAVYTLLGDAPRILLKFNHVGDDILNTNAGIALALLEVLTDAGFAADRFALVEVPEFVGTQFGTRSATAGFDEPITVAGRADQLARWFTEADAVINVGLLKTHPLAGMSGCMKNVSHAIVRHPARYHGEACAPHIAEIVGHPAVSSRLLLNITNAIRVVCRNGPDAREEDLGDYCGLLMGVDPVAVDAVGLSVLAEERRRRAMPGTVHAPFIAAAAARGLGRWRPADIERVAVEIPG